MGEACKDALRLIESQPRTCGGRMTGNRAKICTAEGKSPVEVRRKNAKMLDFRRISVFLRPFWEAYWPR